MSDQEWALDQRRKMLDEKALALAMVVYPDFEAVIEETLEGWFTEHTTLDRREWEMSYKPQLRRRVMRCLANKFEAEANKPV